MLAALFTHLAAELSATVRRNEALPECVPTEGLMILRDGDPGEPDVTLHPPPEFYSHRVELEVLTTWPTAGRGEAVVDALVQQITAVLPCSSGDGSMMPSETPLAGSLVQSGCRATLRWRPYILSVDMIALATGSQMERTTAIKADSPFGNTPRA